MALITIVTGAFVNQLITGGPHIVVYLIPDIPILHAQYYPIPNNVAYIPIPRRLRTGNRRWAMKAPTLGPWSDLAADDQEELTYSKWGPPVMLGN